MNIVTYFGNRYLNIYREHLKEIREHGFDAVLHPVNEQELFYPTKSLQHLIYETKNQGFTCWVDPHCLGNLFGYGSLSLYNNPIDPVSPQFQEMANNWMGIIKDADWILWDEPKLSPKMYLFLGRYMIKAHEEGIKNSVCLYGSNPFKPTTCQYVENIRTLPIDDFGVSFTVKQICEFTDIENDQDEVVEWLNLLHLYPKDFPSHALSISAWIPGYEIPIGNERQVVRVFESIEKHVDIIGHWGFRGCETEKYSSSDPSKVWELVGRRANALSSSFAHKGTKDTGAN